MRKVCLVAVDIRSTHNVGSFFRTADGFSAEIVLTGITPRPSGGISDQRLPHIVTKAHQAISKTALGAEQSVSWRYFQDIKEAINVLRNEGYTIAALEQDQNSIDISLMPTSESIAIVVGTEVTGLPNEILTLCDNIFEIHMTGGKESFNVSVAAGIALYQSRITKK